MGASKWKNLQELGSQCRILSIFTLLVFGFASVALIAVCSSALGDPPKYPTSKLAESDEAGKPDRDNVSLLITMTVLSILATIASVSMLVASFTRNMWMTIPYWIMILALIGEYMYQLLYHGFCIGKCEGRTFKQFTNVTTEFTANVVRGGGGNYIVSSSLMLALLCYVFLPSFAFFWQCKTKRAEELKENGPKPKTPPRTATPPKRVKSTSSADDDTYGV